MGWTLDMPRTLRTRPVVAADTCHRGHARPVCQTPPPPGTGDGAVTVEAASGAVL